MFAAALAVQQQDTIVDAPAYRSAQLGVSLPRPFDNWVFLPDVQQGTTTVIFQPRDATLSDQLWGALVIANFGRPLALRTMVDRRIAATWRRTFGSSFSLKTRDTLTLDGVAAEHIVVAGVVNRAFLDVEEYLAVRGNEFIALQFRYPRGLPRDSLAAGYLRSLAGFRLTGDASPSARVSRAAERPAVAIESNLAMIEVPDSLQVAAPGALISDLVSAGRRQTRWKAFVGPPDTSVYALGHFRADVRRMGRLTIRVWRNASTDSALARVTDDMLSVVAEAWASYWRDFGPVPTAEVSLVETTWPASRGAAGTIFVGADARSADAPMILRRELSRTWWGGAVRADGRAAFLVNELLPAWSSALLAGDRTGADILSRARAASGDARFREAIQTLVAESRGQPAAVDRFLRVLGDSGSVELRALLR